MATLIRCAPALPPKTRMVNRSPLSREDPEAVISFLIGLPVTTVFLSGKYLFVSSKETNIRWLNLFKIRFVIPGITFCSWMALFILRREAARTAGPEAYPPTPNTNWG